MIQKKRGRPRKFDPEAAVLQAVEVFWEKGYDGTSLDDLTEAMGINRPSLYAAFGDKGQLFLRAIEAYGRDMSSTAVDAFEADGDLGRAVEAFFETALSLATRDGGKPHGCLIGSAAMASISDVEGVGELIRNMSALSRGRLQARFEREIETGGLPPGFPSSQRAALMLELMQGQAFRARLGENREIIAQSADVRISAVLAF